MEFQKSMIILMGLHCFHYCSLFLSFSFFLLSFSPVCAADSCYLSSSNWISCFIQPHCYLSGSSHKVLILLYSASCLLQRPSLQYFLQI